MASSPPLPDGPPAADRATERRLRAEIGAELARLFDERQLLDPRPDDEARIRALIDERVEADQRRAVTANQPLLADAEGAKQRLFDDLLRLGQLEPLLRDDSVEDIALNGITRTFVFRHGRKERVRGVQFDSEEELIGLVKRALAPLGRRLDAASPMVDAALPDGSRLNAVIPPASRYPYVTIRRHNRRLHDLDELTALGTLTPDSRAFLEAAVPGGVTILIGGGTGSGKTTLLNALGACIPPDERIVVVEETSELSLPSLLPDCAGLQARGPNVEGVGEITIRELVRNALRMRPSRIILGEVRSSESLDLLTATLTGHDGSLSTVHASSPREALGRLVTLAMMAPERVPREALVEMVASAIELVVQLRIDPRSRRRRVVSIFEVTGLEGGTIAGNELWADDPVSGRLVWTGIQPRCLAKMRARAVPYTPPPARDA